MTNQKETARERERHGEATTPTGHRHVTSEAFHHGTWPLHRATGDPITLVDGGVYGLATGGLAKTAVPVTLHTLADGRILLYRTLVRDHTTLIGWVTTPMWRLVEVLRIAGVATFGSVTRLELEDLRPISHPSALHAAIVQNASRPRLIDLGLEIGGASC